MLWETLTLQPQMQRQSDARSSQSAELEIFRLVVPPPKRVAQKFHFAILRIEVTRASRGLSAIAELLVCTVMVFIMFL